MLLHKSHVTFTKVSITILWPLFPASSLSDSKSWSGGGISAWLEDRPAWWAGSVYLDDFRIDVEYMFCDCARASMTVIGIWSSCSFVDMGTPYDGFHVAFINIAPFSPHWIPLRLASKIYVTRHIRATNHGPSPRHTTHDRRETIRPATFKTPHNPTREKEPCLAQLPA